MPLFEVAILERPTPKQMEDGAAERLVLGPKAVIANDPQSAGIVVAIEAKELSIDTSRMEVLVRPFAAGR